ncbi:MAG: c-type cytochrome [Nitrospinae bacterium]|nr:c-type cytochrome [Nitrospinota bacterium]
MSEKADMASARETFMTNFKPKLIGLVGINVLIWALSFTVYPMPVSFGIMFSAFTLPFLIFFFLSDRGMALAADGKPSLVKILTFYIGISGVSLAVILGAVAKLVGLPFMFVATIVVCAGLCLALFLLLEFKPPMAEPTPAGAFNNMLLVYLGASVLYVATTILLPQYDPKFEIEKIKAAELSLAGADKPTIIKAGKEVFKDFECHNCHNTAPGGEPKRGPNLAEIDMGGEDKIAESLVDPYKEILKPYADNPKVARSMPDYYGKQMSADEQTAVVTYLASLKESAGPAVSTDKMPEGWWTDPAVLAEGQKIFEGLVNEDVACHVCHGKEGVVQFEGATDFRLSPHMIKNTDARFFQIVKFGFGKDNPMIGWRDYLDDAQVWKVIAYTWTFYSKHTLKSEEPVAREDPAGKPDAIDVIKEQYWD